MTEKKNLFPKERLTYNPRSKGYVGMSDDAVQIVGADNDTCEEVCRMQGKKGCKNCPIELAFKKLKYYEDLEEQGRLIIFEEE